MCIVSMISDHYMRQWPVHPGDRDAPGWTKIRWEEYQDLLRKAAELDRITNQPDCIDPKKKEFNEAVEKILRDKGII